MTRTFLFAGKNITRNIPVKQIYIENHPFKDNDLVTFTADTAAIAISTDNNPSTTFDLPSTVYISNSSRNTIGIKTGLGADYSDVFFISGGQDKDTYSFETNYTQITGNVEKNVAKVSIVGVGIRSHAGVAAKAFQALSENEINIGMISTSEIKLTLVIEKDDLEKAVKVLHDVFELDK